MLTDSDKELLKYIIYRLKEINQKGSRHEHFKVVRDKEVIFKFFTKNIPGKDHGYYPSQDAVLQALEKLIKLGYLTYNGEGYKIDPLWKDTESDILRDVNCRTGIFERIHTFKSFNNYHI